MRAGSRVARALASGWQFSGILVFQSGTPFSILAGSSGSLNTRPYLIGNPDLSSGRARSEVIQQYFNTAAFSFTDADNGTFGNSGRNILQGPGTKNWDASIMRMFSFTERYRLQFRADFFNLTNRVALKNPSNDLSANDFGQITEAGDPRILQFSLKFLF